MIQDNLNIRLDEDIANQMTVNKNLSQEIIVTNTDKVTIILNEHHKIIKKKIEWLNPLGIFATIFTTLLTAKFDKTVLGVGSDMWKAIFVVSGLVTLGYSIYLIIRAIKYYNHGTVEEFISKLKNQSQDMKNTAVAPPAQKKDEIIIHSAKYGAEDKFTDITEKISALVSTNNIEIKASNKLWGDPNPGKHKSLIIDCSVNGNRKQITIFENATTKIE